jgi:hypothetical protein
MPSSWSHVVYAHDRHREGMTEAAKFCLTPVRAGDGVMHSEFRFPPCGRHRQFTVLVFSYPPLIGDDGIVDDAFSWRNCYVWTPGAHGLWSRPL